MTLYKLALRHVGQIAERPGAHDHPAIVWAHSLTQLGQDVHDEVPWCSSMLNLWCWLLELPRSKSALARSWLDVAESIDLHDATVGWAIVVLKRGQDERQGHVGVFAGLEFEQGLARWVRVIGGNQSNGISIARFDVADVIGVRRLIA